MAERTRTTAAEKSSSEQVGNPDRVQAQRETPASPSASVLELQRTAGNQAVSGLLQRFPVGEVASTAPHAIADELGSPNAYLMDTSTRRFMEERFDRDFGAVRLHRGAGAQRSADAVGARAFTVGRHIVLGQPSFHPQTISGRSLLAHELAHVLQQRGVASSPPARLTVTPASSPLEREADATASAVMSTLAGGRSAPDAAGLAQEQPLSTVAALQVSRQEESSTAAATAQTPVSRIEISLVSNKIDFHTSQGMFRYQLEQKGLVPGTYQMTVSVRSPQEVNFSGTTDLFEGRGRGSFGYRIRAGQPNPATFFGSQTSVTMIVRNEPAPEITPSEPAEPEATSAGEVLSLTPEEAALRCAANDLPGVKVFPLRFTRFGAAPISAERVGNKIRVRQPLNSVYGNPDFRAQTRTLPLDTFLGGVLLDPNEIVRVHIYRPKWYHLNITGSTEGDEEEEFCVTGEQMLQFGEASTRATWFNIGLTAVDALTLFIPVGKVVQMLGQPLLRGARVLGVAGMLGLREAVPTALGGIASRAPITLIEEQAISRTAGVAVQQTVRHTVVQTAEHEIPQLVAPQIGQRLAGPGATLTLDIAGRTGLEATVEAAGAAGQSALTPGAPLSQTGQPAGEEVFGQLAQELGAEAPGTVAVSRTRGSYPDFEPLPSTAGQSLQTIAQQQTQQLSSQLGIPVPSNRVLVAPWVGRVRGQTGQITSYGTSQGWLRNESAFWRTFRNQFPEDFGLLGPNRTVSQQLAQRWGWPTSGPNNVVGQRLVHHHIQNGSLVVAIPESLHVRLSGAIHATPTVVGTP